MRRADPHIQLLRQLQQLCEDYALDTAYRSSSNRAWHSATFTGTWHRFRFQHHSAEAVDRRAGLAKALPDHEFTLIDHIVADIVITLCDEDPLAFIVEALTVESC